jgi:two-component system cell cycle response regulator
MQAETRQKIGVRLAGGEMGILVVDDSPTQAIHLREILVANGHRATLACGGLEALALLRECRPEIVISDVVMPDMDGYELCRAIRSEARLHDVPVVLLTSLSEPQHIIRGLECGADNFLLKPYDETALLSHIQYILLNQELRRQSTAEMGIEIFFGGQKHFVTSDRMQIMDLLFSTFESAIQKNRELEATQRELRRAQARIHELESRAPGSEA